MGHRFGAVLFCGLILGSMWAEPQGLKKADLSAFPVVGYCDLMRDPGAYDGKQIAVQATYRYGFEIQELFCLKCRGQAKTWLEFEEGASIKFRRAPRHNGLINATFYGIFLGKRGAYGDGGYRYQFNVHAVRNQKVISGDGRDPTLLPLDVKKRLCQE